jgi:hypothetical protein
MTRINVAISPKELTNKHLIAEHREIKRIPNAISKGKYNMNNMPDKFCLGPGHVKFFYNKLLYLKNRYEELYNECIERNFNITYYGSAWDDVPIDLMNDYVPTDNDELIIRKRLKEKIRK